MTGLMSRTVTLTLVVLASACSSTGRRDVARVEPQVGPGSIRIEPQTGVAQTPVAPVSAPINSTQAAPVGVAAVPGSPGPVAPVPAMQPGVPAGAAPVYAQPAAPVYTQPTAPVYQQAPVPMVQPHAAFASPTTGSTFTPSAMPAAMAPQAAVPIPATPQSSQFPVATTGATSQDLGSGFLSGSNVQLQFQPRQPAPVAMQLDGAAPAPAPTPSPSPTPSQPSEPGQKLVPPPPDDISHKPIAQPDPAVRQAGGEAPSPIGSPIKELPKAIEPPAEPLKVPPKPAINNDPPKIDLSIPGNE